jgi:DNA polymerase III delta subunit
MVIYLYGEDSYRRNRKLKELVRAYEKKNPSVDVAVFDLEENSDDWQRAKDFLNQPSMFVDAKLAVIKEVQAAGDKEWIKTLKEQVGAEKIFVIVSDKKSPKKEFRFLSKAPVKSQEFNELEGAALAGFLKKEAALRNLGFTEEASRFFLSYIADSKERSVLAVRELEKLYLLGLRGEIQLTRLQTAIRFEKKEAVWRAASAILGRGSVGRKLGVLERVLLQREAPSYVFNSLGFQARDRQALRLADYDISLKSGGLEYEEALTDFILSSS